VLPPFLDNLDIFHIQWAKTLVQYPEFIEKLKCPVVLSLRGAHINYSPLSDKVLAQKYMKYFPIVAGFHAVSAAISLEAQKYGADPKKITIIPPAVKSELTEKWAVEKSIQINDELKIISVGRCHWKKGYTYALDAMALLKKKDVQFHYTIIAGGRDQENILYQIHDLGLNKCVSFINDKLSHDEVLKKVSECDLFLLPSLEEGISNAVLEAMALGIPTISTDCGGMREVICDKKNGFIIPFREPVMMAKKIKEFSSMNETERRYISENARKTILEKYLLNEQINEMVNLYQNVLKYN
jgi:colanic acid/amylovoran biosynthesis glycosyltransferase